jgi:hypothetical protein
MAGKDMTRVPSDVLKEIKVGEEFVGYRNDAVRIAILNPQDYVSKENLASYREKMRHLRKIGYRVVQRNGEKSRRLSRRRVYEILEAEFGV